MFKKSSLSLLSATALVAVCLSVSACAPLGIATGVGAMAGKAAAKEGGIRGSLEDTRIRAEISDLWFKYKYDAFSKLNLEVEQGRVLITGVVQDPEYRVEAVRLAWQPKGVKQVINEVRIGKSAGIVGYAQDTWIAGNIRTKMIAHENVQSINYTIEVVQGSVYLMGVAQDQAELDRVIRIGKTTPGVKEVISYVKMLGEKVNGGAVSSSIGMGSASGTGGGTYPVQPYVDPGMVSSTAPVPLSGGNVGNGPGDGYVPPAVPVGQSSSSSSVESEVLPP